MPVTLQAPPGCVEVSYGQIRMRPNLDGSITVPEYVAVALIEAGFTGSSTPSPRGMDVDSDSNYILHAYGMRTGLGGIPPDQAKAKALELLQTWGSPQVRINP
jgi:hypothetical protein